MNRLTRTAPKEIFLQISDDEFYLDEEFPKDLESITWCADSVVNSEVKYIRADLCEEKS